MSDGLSAVTKHLRRLVIGEEDSRLRATWRVLLAVLILWTLSQRVLISAVLVTVESIPPLDTPAGPFVVALIRIVFFIVAMVIWARYIDRLSLSNYGISLSGEWFQRLLGGFAAVLLVMLAWNGIAAAVGWLSLDLVLSNLQVEIVYLIIALGVGAVTQQIVFFRVVLKNAAEGLHSRGIVPPRAVVGGLLIGVLFFVVIHNLSSAIRVLDLVVVGLVFGLLYIHTGDLGFSVGVHLGIWFLGSVLFTGPSGQGSGTLVFEKTGSLPGVLGSLDAHGFPKVFLAYLLVVTWIRWRHGRVPLHREIARRAD